MQNLIPKTVIPLASKETPVEHVTMQQPDGTTVLVKLDRQLLKDKEEIAKVSKHDTEAAMTHETFPTYRPPTSGRDEALFHSISIADGAVKKASETAANQGITSTDWIKQMEEADAALRNAIATTDQVVRRGA